MTDTETNLRDRLQVLVIEAELAAGTLRRVVATLSPTDATVGALLGCVAERLRDAAHAATEKGQG